MEAAQSTGAVLPAMLGALEARERELQTKRARRDFRQRLRAQRIMELYETQCHEVNELRRYLQLVADHSHSLEGAVRAAGGEDGSVPIGASLLSQAADVQASMLLCVRDAAVVRDTLTRHHEHHRPHMNALLNKMEFELCRWSEFVNVASRSLVNSIALMDNIRNMAEVQRRSVSEVSRSVALRSPPPACSTPLPVSRE